MAVMLRRRIRVHTVPFAYAVQRRVRRFTRCRAGSND